MDLAGMTRIVRAELDRLEALGSVKAIAEDLLAIGCRGIRQDPKCCVLAMRLSDLLIEEPDFDEIVIAPPRVTVFADGDPTCFEDLDMGPLVESFVAKFDHGKFRKLLIGWPR